MQIQVLVEAGVAEDRIFIDEMSGAKAGKDRPQMAKLLEYAREGDVICVWRVDRLGRSLVDVINTVIEISARGIRLHSIMGGVETKARLARQMMCDEAKAAKDAAEAVGWSLATFYRYLKQYGNDVAPSAEPAVTHGRGRSGYGQLKRLPVRPGCRRARASSAPATS